jgi:cytochrome c oxidase subunit 3
MTNINSHEATLHLDHGIPAQGAKIGMWLFLFTELLLFGGMFLLYAVYRTQFPLDFHNAASDLNVFVGTMNTVILLTSSLTMALAIAALTQGSTRLSLSMLAITILCGAIFMVNKYVEWTAKFHHGIYPGSELLEARSHGENLFYGLYFVMTGLHGLHVLIGMIVLSILFIFVAKNPYEKIVVRSHQLGHIFGSRVSLVDENNKSIWQSDTKKIKEMNIHKAYEDSSIDKINHRDITRLENGGLYWHLVDIIWIFLFPLFYLIT